MPPIGPFTHIEFQLFKREKVSNPDGHPVPFRLKECLVHKFIMKKEPGKRMPIIEHEGQLYSRGHGLDGRFIETHIGSKTAKLKYYPVEIIKTEDLENADTSIKA